MNKEVKEIVRALPPGYHVERRKSGHYAVISPNGHMVYSLPSTPGRGRALQNLRAVLKREGLFPCSTQQKSRC